MLCLKLFFRLLYFCKSLEASSRDIQSPEAELLYYQSPEDQEILLHQAEGNPEDMTVSSWDAGGPQLWYHTFRIELHSVLSAVMS